MEEPLREKHLLRPAQPLGKPSVIAPMIMGKIPVSLQFIIPDLHITNKEKINFQNLIKKCWSEAWDSEIRTFKNKKIEWTLFTNCFYTSII